MSEDQKTQQAQKPAPTWRELFSMSSHIKENNPVDAQVKAMGDYIDLTQEIEFLENKLAKKKGLLSGLKEQILERAPLLGQVIVEHEKTAQKLSTLGNGSAN